MALNVPITDETMAQINKIYMSHRDPSKLPTQA